MGVRLSVRLRVRVCVQYGIKKKVPIEPSQDPALEGRLGRKKKTPEELAAEAQLAEQEAARSSTYNTTQSHYSIFHLYFPVRCFHHCQHQFNIVFKSRFQKQEQEAEVDFREFDRT